MHGLVSNDTSKSLERRLAEASRDEAGGVPLAEAYEVVAYKIRMMLSHVRLQEIFSVLKESPSSTPTMTMQEARREERLRQRKNPFLCFRPMGSNENVGKDEDPTVVTLGFNGTHAEAVMSDGSTLNADAYEKGSDGFVVAIWHDPKMRASIELPNDNCTEDGQLTAMEVPQPRPKAPPKKNEETASVRGCIFIGEDR